MSNYNMFHCINNSDKYLIVIGDSPDKYVEYETAVDAIKDYDLIGEIEASPFSACVLIPPHHVDKRADWAGGEIATESVQDNAQKVNADYISKRIKRWNAKDFSEPAVCSQAVSKFRSEKEWSFLFDRKVS